MVKTVNNGDRIELSSPTALPNASAFLWNKKMMLHMNCRGYAISQFMQPEPTKYAHAPNLEAKTFMQPEQPFYAHHPGRFFYIKNEVTGSLFSAPHEPVRAKIDSYVFSVGKSDIKWKLENEGLEIEVKLCLPKNDVLEKWTFSIKNVSSEKKNVSIYPYFPVGYMSWMNQSGYYNSNLNGIICSSITPYQKYKEYDKIKTLKDKTFFLADTIPDSWEVNQALFEGEGGLQNPTAIHAATLSNSDAIYETPACIMQYRLQLQAGEAQTYRFLFGPALDENEISTTRNQYFANNEFDTSQKEYDDYIAKGEGCLHIKTPDKEFDDFVNNWLPRQIYYHGETNRLSTDPQTRNYLQDNMGMAYIEPSIARHAFITALSQQEESGAMPDGILIQKEAILKYINQVPHTDHCVWLPICMKVYLDETNDYGLLDETVLFAKTEKKETVKEHVNLAMFWLYNNRDERGLNYIDQGDWCDPMNMVGPEGKGVSGWLTLATAYAIKTWAEICSEHNETDVAKSFFKKAEEVNTAVNTHLWDSNWYARGITDNNVTFGIKEDKEGRIFLNSQGWALLSGAADDLKASQLIQAVEDQLETPFGVQMLSPAFTKMREDIGRVTQKFPGCAENGSIYNHASAFYIFGLFATNHSDKAFTLLRQMIPGPDESDLKQRGQIPVFIPNYYRGAYRQFPRTAGRSSQLFNTGTVSWIYRCLIEGLFGLVGTKEGLEIKPQLPKEWGSVSIVRRFRGATFNVRMERVSHEADKAILVDGEFLKGTVIQDIQPKTYEVLVRFS